MADLTYCIFRLVNNAGVGSGRAAAAAKDGAEVYGKSMFAEDIDDWQRGLSA